MSMPRRNIYRALLVFILAVILTGVSAQVGYTQQPTPSDNDVNSVAKGMYCPVCENIPLDVCPTQACAQWRELIREKLADGWSEKQIKDYFVAQYGDRVLAEPPPSGLNRLVYILPPVFFLIGIWIIYRVFKSMRKSKAVAPGAAAGEPGSKNVDDPYLTRLEEELRQLEGDKH